MLINGICFKSLIIHLFIFIIIILVQEMSLNIAYEGSTATTTLQTLLVLFFSLPG